MSRDVTFDEASLMKSTNSQQVESMKTNEISQRVESNATPCTPDSSVSFEIPPEVIQDGDHVTIMMLKMLRIKDMMWARSKYLLQLDEPREIYVSPHGSLQI